MNGMFLIRKYFLHLIHLNINSLLIYISKFIQNQNNTICMKFACSDATKHQQFTSIHDLKDLIKFPT